MEIYERIKARRKEMGLSADDVARFLGVSRATIYRYESADIEKLPAVFLEPLASILKCSVSYLIGLDDVLICNSQSLLSDEIDMINKYRSLNIIGRQKLCERADELFDLGYSEFDTLYERCYGQCLKQEP